MTSLIKEPSLKMIAAGAGSRLLQSENAHLILREALDISGARKPNVLTIGTAEPTQEWYDEFIEATQRQFKNIGANVVDLQGFGKRASAAEADEKIGNADVIWFAGGSTEHLMQDSKEQGLDTKITNAALLGTVIGGGSAGMLVLLNQGHSDSDRYTVKDGKDWYYKFVHGLGLINATGTPHYDSVEDDGKVRSDDFRQKFRADPTLPTTGIGIDNMAALSIIDGQYRALQITGDEKFPRAQVHILKKSDGNITEYVLPANNDYRPFDVAA